MSVVSYSQHKFHPHMNVVTIDGEQVNGLWNENDEQIQISFNVDHDLYDYYGNKLQDNSKSREQYRIVSEFIENTYKKENISHRSGWVTRNQSWSEWTIKK